MTETSQATRNSFLFVLITMIVAVAIAPTGYFDVEDSGFYFVAEANVADLPFPYPYAGYVALVPQLVARLASALPYTLQPLLYAGTAFGAGLWLFVEMRGFLGGRGDRGIYRQVMPGFFVLFMVDTQIFQNYFLNLAYAIWTLVMIAALRVFRMARGEAAPLWAVPFYGLAVATHPYCVGLVLPLLIVTAVRRERRLVLEAAVYLACIAFFVLFLLAPDRPRGLPLLEIPARAVFVFLRHANASALVGLGGAALLAGHALLWLWRAIRARQAALPGFDLFVVSLWGLETLGFYLLSNRLLYYDRVDSHYVVTIAFAAFLLVAALLAPQFSAETETPLPGPTGHTRPFGRREGLLVANLVAFAVMSGLVAWKVGAGVTGVADIAETHAYLAKVADWRAGCGDRRAAFARRWDEWAPVVTCRPYAGTEDLGRLVDGLEVELFRHPEIAPDPVKPPTPPRLWRPDEFADLPGPPPVAR